MNIRNVSVERLDLPLHTPYTIAYETVDRTTNFILRIETDRGLTGFGCAAPDLTVTGESVKATENLIKGVVIPFLKGREPFHYVKILEDLRSVIGESPSVQAMVDMALFDLFAKQAGVPLYQFLGGYRDSIPTSITIGIMSVEDTLRQAREFVSQGFFVLKIKGGACLEEDIEKVLRTREAFPEVALRFDGNQGYSVDQAIAFTEATEAAGIEIFEQPTKITKEKKLGKVTKKVNVPVMADESIKNLADAFRLARKQRIDMVNIKLMKVGGILEGLHINSVAKSAGLEAMVGCIDECALGISAGLHFALSRPNIPYADLDGHLDLVDDPFQGLFTLKKGILYPSEKPGLGL